MKNKVKKSNRKNQSKFAPNISDQQNMQRQSTSHFDDNRAESIAQKRQQLIIHNRPANKEVLTHNLPTNRSQRVIQGFWPFTGYGYFWNRRPAPRTPAALIDAARDGNIEGLTCHQAVLTWLRESNYATDNTFMIAKNREVHDVLFNNQGPNALLPARAGGNITVPAGHIIGFFDRNGIVLHSMVSINGAGRWAGYNNPGTWGNLVQNDGHAIIDAAAFPHWIGNGNTLTPAGQGGAAPLTVVYLSPDEINPAYQTQL
jgi:hypothetical protein